MPGDDVDDELAQLREDTDTGDRIDAAAQQTADDDRSDLGESIRDELEAIDAGDRQATVSVWDADLAALVFALDDDEHVEECAHVATTLANALDIDPPADPGKSDVLRLALRLGFRELPEDVREEYHEALRERHAPNL